MSFRFLKTTVFECFTPSVKIAQVHGLLFLEVADCDLKLRVRYPRDSLRSSHGLRRLSSLIAISPLTLLHLRPLPALRRIQDRVQDELRLVRIAEVGLGRLALGQAFEEV